MERPPSIAIPMKIPAEETSTLENLQFMNECCESQQGLRYDVTNFSNDLMNQKQKFTSECLPNMPSVGNDDNVFFTPALCTNPLTENRNSLSNIDNHKIAAMFVRQILVKAVDSIFKNKDLIQYSQKELKKSDSHKWYSDSDKTKICSTTPNDFQLYSALDVAYPEVDGLVPSVLKIPSQDKNCHFVPGQNSGLERNFYTMGSIGESHFFRLEKNNTSGRITNNTNQIEFCVNSTSEKDETKNMLDLSILKDILNGGDNFSSYLPNKTEFENLSTADNREITMFLPKCDLKIQEKTAVDNLLCQTLKKDVKNTFCSQSNVALAIDKTTVHFSKQFCNIGTETISCNLEKLATKTVTNDLDRIIQCKTSSVVNEIKSNQLASLANSVHVKGQINHSNLISTDAYDSSRNVSLSGEQHTFQFNSIQSDQTVPSVFINGVMQNILEKRRDGSIKTVTQRTSALKEMSLPYCEIKTSDLNETRTSDHMLPLCNDYSTNDCDDAVISLDLLQMLTVKRTKTVVEHNFKFYSRNNIDLPYMFRVNKTNNVAKHQGIGNSTIVGASDIKTTNPVPTDCGLNLCSSIKAQSSTCNEEAHKPYNFDYNDFLEISNSSWSDIDQIKDCVDVAEKSLDKIVEESVMIELPSLNESDNGNFIAPSGDSDVDELDRAIDDSIKKYENFTVDASILAVPSTAEKYCQTELTDHKNVARCKRCLEFVDQPTESIKKIKLNSKEESDFKLATTSVCHISFNDPSVNSSVCHNIRNDNQRLPVQKERVQFGSFSSLINNMDHLTTNSYERFPKLYSPRRDDDVHELDDEGSLYDLEDNDEHDQMDVSIESSYDSEQEVPINRLANEGLPPPFSFVTPKKPVLRVGLSRSARFRPLHPKM